MATHSSILAWEIPRTEEPGGLQSMGSQKSRVQLSNYTAITTNPKAGVLMREMEVDQSHRHTQKGPV